MFQYFKKHHYLYSCYGIIKKSHRRKGYFTHLLTCITEPHFFVAKEKSVEDLAIKQGAKYFVAKNGNKVPNRTNRGKTHYLVMNFKKNPSLRAKAS
ncbi:MAG: hypothetical protein P1V18_05900 [Candidatus Gracilibacteria bacterium]|nr:hypothetical protein [Candidatus Gracilibacteria bacterium]